MIASLLLMSVGHASAEGPPALEGRYWMTLNVESRVRVPVLGWLPSTTISTVLVDLQSDGQGGLVQRHEVCAIQIDSRGRKAQTTIPPAFVEALPIKRYEVDIRSDGEGWRYAADMGEDHVGYDPLVASGVPRRARDAGILDPDKDGKPGMTVLLTVPLFGQGELYVVQRGKMTLDGRVASRDRIEGALTVAHLEQRTLKATNPLFSVSPPIEPVPAQSWFRIERAPGASCADLRVASLSANAAE